MLKQRRQRQQIAPVVIDHAPERSTLVPAQIREPGGRRLRTGQVVAAIDLEKMSLDRDEAAVLPSSAICASRGMQQIQVRSVIERMLSAMDPEPTFQQRRVVGAAVVAHR